jgi:drug/metabolite transporter (DMT)-like permease
MPALWMIVASALFAAMGIFVKQASAYFTIYEVVFLRGLFTAGLSALVVIARRATVRTPNVQLHFYRGVTGIVAMFMFYYAVFNLPLATAVTLNSLSPIFLALLTVVLMRERMHLPHVAAVALAFFGTVLLLNPTFREEHWIAGLVGIASAIVSAIAYYNVRSLVVSGEPEDRIVFYFGVTTILAMLPFVATGEWSPISQEAMTPILGMGITATLAQLAMTRAYGRGQTILVAALSYSTVVFSSLFGFAMWQEVLPWSGWIAIVVIIAAGVLAIYAGPAHSGAAEE